MSRIDELESLQELAAQAEKLLGLAQKYDNEISGIDLGEAINWLQDAASHINSEALSIEDELRWGGKSDFEEHNVWNHVQLGIV